MVDEFRNRGISKATDLQIQKALKLADEWAKSNARFSHPDPEIQKQIIRNIYPKALESANNWLVAILPGLSDT